MDTEEQYNIVDINICLFTIDKNKIKVLLFHRSEEPYKGYWMLPNQLLTADLTIEDSVNQLLEQYGIPEINLQQGQVFSTLNRTANHRTLGITFYGAIDSKMFELKETIEQEYAWFEVDLLPKMIYDHADMVHSSCDRLKQDFLTTNLLTELFPSDFTLPELQTIYESALQKSLDRRNFRKKLVQADLLEDTGDKNDSINGRPAKLYRFKENANVKNLFLMR